MQKGIKIVAVGFLIATSLFIDGGKSAGQSIEPITDLPTINTNLKPLKLSRGNNTKQPPKRLKSTETEAKTPSKPKPNYKEITVKATAYVSYCDTGCTGVTATGLDVKHTIKTPKGYGIIAVDPKVIPLGSIVEVNGKKYKAEDTGGAIKGNHIDILVSTTDTDKAFDFGSKHLTVKVYSKAL